MDDLTRFLLLLRFVLWILDQENALSRISGGGGPGKIDLETRMDPSQCRHGRYYHVDVERVPNVHLSLVSNIPFNPDGCEDSALETFYSSGLKPWVCSAT